MYSTGLFTQPPDFILQDLEDFCFGNLPWFHGTRHCQDGAHVAVTMADPDSEELDETSEHLLTAQAIKTAYTEAKKRGYHLCCADEIEAEGLGHGCAQDLDILLQTACYGRLELA